MGRLRIMVRGVEQCVRLISVIVLRVGAIQISDFAQCLVSKAAKVHSSRAVAGRGLVYGGHAGAYHHTTSVDPGPPCVFKVMHVELYPRLPVTVVFLKFFYPPSRSKAPDICTPSSRALGAAPAPTASRGACDASCDAEGNRECNPGFCRRLRLRSCISEISF